MSLQFEESDLSKYLKKELHHNFERYSDDMVKLSGMDEEYIKFQLNYSLSQPEIEFLIEKASHAGITMNSNAINKDSDCVMSLVINKKIKEALREQEGSMSSEAIEIWHQYRREHL